MSSPAPQSSPSPDSVHAHASTSTQAGPAPAEDTLDPLSTHFLGLVNSLKSKAKDDSDLISTLQTRLNQLEQVQEKQQAELERVKNNCKDRGAHNPARPTNDNFGRQRSVSPTLESISSAIEEKNESSATQLAEIVKRLEQAEATVVNEVRENAAYVDCECGEVASDAADAITSRIERLETTLLRALEVKELSLFQRLTRVQDDIEASVQGSLETAACSCSAIEDARASIEAKLNNVMFIVEDFDAHGLAFEAHELRNDLNAAIKMLGKRSRKESSIVREPTPAVQQPVASTSTTTAAQAAKAADERAAKGKRNGAFADRLAKKKASKKTDSAVVPTTRQVDGPDPKKIKREPDSSLQSLQSIQSRFTALASALRPLPDDDDDDSSSSPEL